MSYLVLRTPTEVSSADLRSESDMTTATTTTVEKQTWTIDSTHSLVEFTVKHMMIATVKGRFGEVQGVVVQEPEGDWGIEVRIASEGIDTRSGQRDAHLRSPDFFASAQYPAITFRSRGIEGDFSSPGDRLQVAGDLTIRDVTKEVVLDVTYEGEGRDPWGGDRMSFSATTRIDRRDYGLTWNQGLEAGGVLVSNEVTINLDVQLVKQASED